MLRFSMRRVIGRSLFAIAIAGTLLAASGASASTASATQRKRHRKPAVKVVAPPPAPVPAPPPPPAYPVHDPAVPPEVSYVNGQLLIDAKNSTLSDVLKAVEKDTGATFDISSGDTSERVVGRIGPGTPRDVMAELLNGSHFNYVMLSPIGNPSALSKVLLTPRSKGSAGQTYTAQQQPPQTFQQPMQISPGLPIQQQVQQQNAAAEESSDNGDAAADENADNQNQDQPENQPETQDAAQAVQAPQQPPGVKTPEQLLQELRQQQQQVIQQQQIPQGAQPQPDDNR
jgi:hypothetical protein